MISVAILDDHPLILSGMKSVLDTESDIEVIGTYTSSSMLFISFKEQLPDVLLLDLNLKNETGDQILQFILQDYPTIKVIMLTNIDTHHIVKNLLQLGAKGYLLKTTSLDKLAKSIRQVAQNDIVIAEEIKENMIKANFFSDKSQQLHKFSQREIEILQLIANEQTTQEIAQTLKLSNRTIDNYRLGLMQKLDSKNMIGMVKKAMILGLIK